LKEKNNLDGKLSRRLRRLERVRMALRNEGL
jgi:hypothetical protein